MPRSLERLVTALLEKVPADRPVSAADVVARLEKIEDEMASAHGGEAAVRAALSAAGYAVDDERQERAKNIGEASARRAPRSRRGPRYGRPLPPVASFVVVSAVIIVTSIGLRLTHGRAHETTGGGEPPLELLPAQAGFVRVIATPWADVAVDGQPVDVTPFARIIPLRPGPHDITLRHPDAPDELRRVDVRPGATITLDVTMDLRGN